MQPAPEAPRGILKGHQLPDLRVPDLPDDWDPMDDGLLMAHQVEWIADQSPLKACEKGRRTGITFAEALDDTLKASTRRSDGGDNVYYIGDTKDKALEFVAVCANFSRAIGAGLQDVEEYLFEDKLEDGSSKYITSYRITFASGNQIVGLSSRPENLRGLQGRVVIDEAAFHEDVEKVLAAANALLIWGSDIRIISTHNGESNPFNALIEKSREGKRPFSIHRIDFDQAVENGLYERVCMVKGWKPTDAGKAKWYKTIFDSYDDAEDRDEELFVIPSRGSGVYLTRALIRPCMNKDLPVLRLTLPVGFEQRPDWDRESFVEAWLQDAVDPLLALLDPMARSYFGQDFARSSDLSIIAPGQVMQNLVLKVPFVIEMRNVPFREQEQILFHVIAGLPRFCKGFMDARGNGQALAEFTQQKFGFSRIEAVMATANWYLEHMPPMKARFEDHTIETPADADHEDDLRRIKKIQGIPRVPEARGKDAGGKRHGDFAIALCNLVAAADAEFTEIAFKSTGEKRTSMDSFGDGMDRGEEDMSRGFGVVGKNSGLGGF